MADYGASINVTEDHSQDDSVLADSKKINEEDIYSQKLLNSFKDFSSLETLMESVKEHTLFTKDSNFIDETITELLVSDELQIFNTATDCMHEDYGVQLIDHETCSESSTAEDIFPQFVIVVSRLLENVSSRGNANRFAIEVKECLKQISNNDGSGDRIKFLSLCNLLIDILNRLYTGTNLQDIDFNPLLKECRAQFLASDYEDSSNESIITYLEPNTIANSPIDGQFPLNKELDKSGYELSSKSMDNDTVPRSMTFGSSYDCFYNNNNVEQAIADFNNNIRYSSENGTLLDNSEDTLTSYVPSPDAHTRQYESDFMNYNNNNCNVSYESEQNNDELMLLESSVKDQLFLSQPQTTNKEVYLYDYMNKPSSLDLCTPDYHLSPDLLQVEEFRTISSRAKLPSTPQQWVKRRKDVAISLPNNAITANNTSNSDCNSSSGSIGKVSKAKRKGETVILANPDFVNENGQFSFIYEFEKEWSLD